MGCHCQKNGKKCDENCSCRKNGKKECGPECKCGGVNCGNGKEEKAGTAFQRLFSKQANPKPKSTKKAAKQANKANKAADKAKPLPSKTPSNAKGKAPALATVTGDSKQPANANAGKAASFSPSNLLAAKVDSSPLAAQPASRSVLPKKRSIAGGKENKEPASKVKSSFNSSALTKRIEPTHETKLAMSKLSVEQKLEVVKDILHKSFRTNDTDALACVLSVLTINDDGCRLKLVLLAAGALGEIECPFRRREIVSCTLYATGISHTFWCLDIVVDRRAELDVYHKATDPIPTFRGEEDEASTMEEDCMAYDSDGMEIGPMWMEEDS